MAANVLTTNPIYMDTAATISKPLWIKKLVLISTAALASLALTYTSEGATVKFAQMATTGTDWLTRELDFGNGFYVPNLTVGTLTSSVLYIYLA